MSMPDEMMFYQRYYLVGLHFLLNRPLARRWRTGGYNQTPQKKDTDSLRPMIDSECYYKNIHLKRLDVRYIKIPFLAYLLRYSTYGAERKAVEQARLT